MSKNEDLFFAVVYSKINMSDIKDNFEGCILLH